MGLVDYLTSVFSLIFVDKIHQEESVRKEYLCLVDKASIITMQSLSYFAYLMFMLQYVIYSVYSQIVGQIVLL